MKKLVIVVLFLVLINIVFAGTTMNLSSYDINMESTDTAYIKVCIYDMPGFIPRLGVDVTTYNICRDVDEDGYCFSPEDILEPSYFTVVTISNITGTDGCTDIMLKTIKAPIGIYSYQVNGLSGFEVRVGTANVNVSCNLDSDCGTNVFMGGEFCSSENLYQNFLSFSCVNPGTKNSYCTNTTDSVLKGTCNQEKKETTLSNSDLYITNVIFSQVDRLYLQDNNLEFSIFLRNTGQHNLEDLQISIVIYDLGIYYSFDRFRLNAREQLTRTAYFSLPSGIPKGNYDARIVVSNDDIKRVLHREIAIY